jgi:putative glutamine amidotransferase
MGAHVSLPAGERPLIGVTTSEIRRKGAVRRTPQGEPAQTELALGVEYVRAIEAAGGLPVVLPALDEDAVEPLVGQLAGLCLSGGPDLEPAAYGALPHAALGPTEPHVDRFELAAARRAWDLGVPLLAICRGTQALNVARGGTLLQHLPDVAGEHLRHRQAEPANRTTHAVRIEGGTALAGLIGEEEIQVNSFHHQAVDRLGDGLRVTARSTDGVVEGVEATGRPFVIGVQWHAECLAARTGERALFAGLVRAASRYERARNARRAA